ncbi:MAG TPA: glutamate--tRNA ligase [Anaerolineae bacterium]|nr:glutamate--tRNA ligase [Anaerolineae bacterium]
MTEKPTRVRFAPSPTGYLHIGSARSALFNWLYARHTGGKFILRIEDTDQKRLVTDALDDFAAGLRWLGCQWDEGPEVGGDFGPYFQSQRLELYQTWANWLVEHGHAYRCYCSEERLGQVREEQTAAKEQTGYDRHCRTLTPEQRAQHQAAGDPYVIRLAVEPLDGSTTFHDAIRGEITFEHSLLQDAVLLKSDGWPTYHLAAVVDDHLMQISHIMRSDEWLSSAPLGVLLYQAFGWEQPVWAHLPVILNPNGKGKMSKRHAVGADGRSIPVLLKEYIADGYLPEAMANFLANVGWNLDGSTEIFAPEQAIAAFDIAAINPSPAAFPYDKLVWLNGVYIRQLEDDELYRRLLPLVAAGMGMSEAALAARPELRPAVPLIKERIKTLGEAAPMLDFFFVDGLLAYPDPQALVGEKMTAAQTVEALHKSAAMLAGLPSFDHASIEASLRALSEELGLKIRQLLHVVRVAVTGTKVSPPLFESIVILGRERTLTRLAAAAESVNSER